MIKTAVVLLVLVQLVQLPVTAAMSSSIITKPAPTFLTRRRVLPIKRGPTPTANSSSENGDNGNSSSSSSSDGTVNDDKGNSDNVLGNIGGGNGSADTGENDGSRGTVRGTVSGPGSGNPDGGSDARTSPVGVRRSFGKIKKGKRKDAPVKEAENMDKKAGNIENVTNESDLLKIDSVNVNDNEKSKDNGDKNEAAETAGRTGVRRISHRFGFNRT
jgi:hypothetical protein